MRDDIFQMRRDASLVGVIGDNAAEGRGDAGASNRELPCHSRSLASDGLHPLYKLLVGDGPIGDPEHGAEELVMGRLERMAREPQAGAEQGRARALVSIRERVVGYNAEAKAARLRDVALVEVGTPESLIGLGEGRVEHALVAHARNAAEPIDGGIVYDNRLFFGDDGGASHLASSVKTSAYSSMKSIATSTASSLAAALAGWMTTQGLLFFSTVTGRPVRFTSAVTFEKLFFASARPIVMAAMAAPFELVIV
jgi:hypothetical protein